MTFEKKVINLNMDDTNRVATLYSRILQNLQSQQNCTHKLCYIQRNNKVEPIIIKLNSNTKQDNLIFNDDLLSGTRTHAATKPAFRIIEPIVIKKPIITEHEKNLEDELKQFKLEIDQKYHKSTTNTYFRYPIQTSQSSEDVIDSADIYSTQSH